MNNLYIDPKPKTIVRLTEDAMDMIEGGYTAVIVVTTTAVVVVAIAIMVY